MSASKTDREQVGAAQDSLDVTVRGHALVATIDRPHSANSIDLEVVEGLERAVERVAADDALTALVITAVGDRFFAAGGDIKRYRTLSTQAELDAAFERPRVLMDALEACPKPVIAAVNGLAVGGGVELLLACDYRIASATARIGFPYAKLGVMPGWNGTERLVRDCGRATAMALLLRAENVDAQAALEAGLVQDVVPADELTVRTDAFVAQLASFAPLSLGALKRAVHACAELQDQQRAVNTQAFAKLWVSEDHREAEAAFVEKRKPKFVGR